jgi:hypothetical protein
LYPGYSFNSFSLVAKGGSVVPNEDPDRVLLSGTFSVLALLPSVHLIEKFRLKVILAFHTASSKLSTTMHHFYPTHLPQHHSLRHPHIILSPRQLNTSPTLSPGLKIVIGLTIPFALLPLLTLLVWVVYGRKRVARLTGETLIDLEERRVATPIFSRREVSELDSRDVLEIEGRELRVELAATQAVKQSVHELDATQQPKRS